MAASKTRAHQQSYRSPSPRILDASDCQVGPTTLRWTIYAAAAIIALAGLAAYANSFGGEFLFDDHIWIGPDSSIRQLWPLWPVLFPPSGTLSSGRPVLNLSLAINYAVGGTNVWGYHAVNVGIHLLAALVLFGVVRRTLLTPALRDQFGRFATALAFAIAAVWVVHPLGTAAVTYIIQRTEALAALSFLLTLYCVIRGATSTRSAAWYCGAVASCLLGMATKEVMATLPLVVLLYDRTLLSGSFAAALKRRWGLYLGMAATWGVVVWCLVSTGFHGNSTGFGVERFTPLSYAATQPGVILHYLRLAIWPIGLVLDYDWPAANSLVEIAPPAIVIAVLVGLTIWGLLKNKPAALLGAWFFGILAPTSSIVPIRDAAFEHRMYLPLIAVIMLVVLGGFTAWIQLLRRWKMPNAATTWRGSLVSAIALAAIVALLGWATVRRNTEFRNGESIWRATIAERPNNARAHSNLAAILIDRGDLVEGMKESRRALELRKDYVEAETNLALAFAKQRRFDEAFAHYQRALELRKGDKRATELLCEALVAAGKLDSAIALCNDVLSVDPHYVKFRVWLADCLGKQGRTAEAIENCKRALADDPTSAAAENIVGSMLARDRRFDEAIFHFQTAIRLEPEHADAHLNLGMIYYGRGNDVKAERYWRTAAQLGPNRVEYLRPLAWVLATSHDPIARNGREAVELAERAMAASPQPDPNVIGTLAAAYAETGDFVKAAANAERARDLAERQGNDRLSDELSQRLMDYRNGKPFHGAKPLTE